ncbi:MAG: Re/Si-specific NAD(P)(+) transhydrogenase subunit alpha [Capsulimonadaceae bacterium]
MILAVPRETKPGERRVALVPDSVSRLSKLGVTVHVETGAGDSAGYLTEAYRSAGATIVADAAALYGAAEIVVKVGRPSCDELSAMRPGTVVVGFLSPLGDPAYVQQLATRGVSGVSMEAIPRTTRSQAMDALSSQSNIAGYKAVLIGATTLPKFFPMLTTAAGTVAPARVLIIGAGVAGLQAIATARRLGAIVSAYDTRAVVKEQVKSLGAEFLEIDLGEDAQTAGGYAKELSAEAIEKQRQFMVKHIGASDVVITTALVPGRRAPLLVTEEAVQAMKPGSVIVDLAAENGGNCAFTQPDQTVEKFGVSIIGPTNLPATVPLHASQLYARNIVSLLGILVKDGKLNLDFEDDIIRDACLTHEGKVLHKPTLAALESAQGGNQ